MFFVFRKDKRLSTTLEDAWPHGIHTCMKPQRLYNDAASHPVNTSERPIFRHLSGYGRCHGCGIEKRDISRTWLGTGEQVK